MKINQKLRPFVILGIVFVVLLATYVGLKAYNTKVAEEETASSEAETIYLTKQGKTKKISYTNGTKTMTFSLSDDAWTEASATSTELSSSSVSSIASYFGKLTATRKLTTNLEEISAYGLDNPAYKISVTNKKGKTQTILIGNALADGSYYAKLADEPAIYVIATGFESYLTFDLNSLVASPTIPTMSSNNVNSIEQIKADGTTKKIDNDATSSSEEASEKATSTSTESTPYDTATTALVSLVSYGAVNYKPTVSDLSTYGLDKESRTTYTVNYLDENEIEKSFTFYVGKASTTEGYQYVQFTESVVIYQLSESTVTSLESAFN
ncbi:DUF4340 domain-containing protein [Enterococcus camelliae]|uniref:DUF4340 domain-containing protein n=1 Tax=Enterococcus camelliae TaxID=453959 RepID=A0ABW5TJS7_9ENTE